MKKINKESKGVSIAKFAVGTTARLGVSYLVGSTAGIIMHVANAGRFMKLCGTTGALGLGNGVANYAAKQWDDMIDVYIDAYNDIVDLTEE
jgi:hypothetical protein